MLQRRQHESSEQQEVSLITDNIYIHQYTECLPKYIGIRMLQKESKLTEQYNESDETQIT